MVTFLDYKGNFSHRSLYVYSLGYDEFNTYNNVDVDCVWGFICLCPYGYIYFYEQGTCLCCFVWNMVVLIYLTRVNYAALVAI